jgi:hypothetical protein
MPDSTFANHPLSNWKISTFSNCDKSITTESVTELNASKLWPPDLGTGSNLLSLQHLTISDTCERSVALYIANGIVLIEAIYPPEKVS